MLKARGQVRPLFAEDGSCASQEGRGRYGYRWWHLNEPAKWVRGLDRFVCKILGDPSYRRPLPLPYLVHLRQRDQVWWGTRSRGPGVPIHVGGQWMSLSARAMEAICSSDGKVRSFFRHVPVADEACLHTILVNAGNLTFAAGLILLMVSVTYGIRPYGSHATGWGSPRVIALLVAGVAFLVAFAVIELRSDQVDARRFRGDGN